MSLARAWTQTAWIWDLHTNHEATAPAYHSTSHNMKKKKDLQLSLWSWLSAKKAFMRWYAIQSSYTIGKLQADKGDSTGNSLRKKMKLKLHPIFKAKQTIFHKVTPHLQPIRVLFHRATQVGNSFKTNWWRPLTSKRLLVMTMYLAGTSPWLVTLLSIVYYRSLRRVWVMHLSLQVANYHRRITPIFKKGSSTNVVSDTLNNLYRHKVC